MTTACPRCGAAALVAGGLCPECLKRVALGEPLEMSESEAGEANELLPETAQRRTGVPAGSPGPAGGGSRERWGAFELLEPLGRGAMGTVFKARHVRLNRLVALKRIREGRQASPEEQERFKREAEAVARLQHPHIVTLYEAGEVGGQPYLAMEYVPGRTLAETIGGKPLPPRQAAECVKKVSEAVQFAHEQGVLHRDLKPSNVALDLNLEPRVMDFGLARLLEQESEMTLSGTALGSPSYMAPEQAAGKVHEVCAASDVYSLGAILYEALTGRPPFQADSPVETMRQAVENEPVSARLLNARVPRDLETICLKCLEKEPGGRYQTAGQLAEELGRYLRDEPITARQIGAAAKLGRWCRRKPALATSMGAAAALLLVVLIGSPIAVLHINRARKSAETAERQTQQQLYTALLEQARATVRSGELGQRVKALDALQRAAALSNTVELRREVLSALSLPDLRFERRLSLPTNATGVQLDPAFERVAVSRESGPVEIRALADDRLLASLPASTNLTAFLLFWSNDGKFLAVKRDYPDGGRTADLEIWDAGEARLVQTIHGCSSDAIAFHPRRPWVVAGQSGAVGIWDLESGRELKRLPFSSDTILRVSLSPDGEVLAALQPFRERTTLTLRSAISGDVTFTRTFPDWVATLAWHPGGRWLALADHDGKVQLLDPQSGETQLLGRHISQAVTLAFSPDGNYLISGGWERALICWDFRTRQRAFSIGLESYHLQFSADGRQCSTVERVRASESTVCFQSLKLHAFEGKVAHREFSEDLGTQLRDAAFSPDGRWLAASANRRCGIWDLRGNEPAALDDEAYHAQFCFTPDGRELFGSRTEAGDSECFRWGLAHATNRAMSPPAVRLPLAKPDGFTCLAVHSNLIVLTGAKGSKLLELAELERSDRYPWVQTSPGFNRISPDGKWLAIRQPFGDTLHIHRLPGMDEVATVKGSPLVGDFHFSPLHDELVTCSAFSRNATFWRTGTWEKTRSLTNVIGFRYTPDARAFWLTTDSRTSGLYDARTLELLLPFPTGMFLLALSRDGGLLAVSVDQRRLQVWDMQEVRRQLRELGMDWEDSMESSAQR